MPFVVKSFHFTAGELQVNDEFLCVQDLRQQGPFCRRVRRERKDFVIFLRKQKLCVLGVKEYYTTTPPPLKIAPEHPKFTEKKHTFFVSFEVKSFRIFIQPLVNASSCGILLKKGIYSGS